MIPIARLSAMIPSQAAPGVRATVAMPNNSNADRTGLLIEYLPKFVKPLEDQLSGVRKEVIDKGGDYIRQLVGLAYPYPQLLDKAEGGNQEGYYSQKY